MRKRVSQEKMRYSVPGVCNRFIGVHIGFILLCALLSVMVVCVALSIIVIGGVHELEPKPSIVFYCEADDAAAAYADEQYSSVLDIYFVKRGDENYTGGYSFEPVITDKTFMIVYSKHGAQLWRAEYSDCGLKIGATLTVDDVDRIIKLGVDKI